MDQHLKKSSHSQSTTESSVKPFGNEMDTSVKEDAAPLACSSTNGDTEDQDVLLIDDDFVDEQSSDSTLEDSFEGQSSSSVATVNKSQAEDEMLSGLSVSEFIAKAEGGGLALEGTASDPFFAPHSLKLDSTVEQGLLDSWLSAQMNDSYTFYKFAKNYRPLLLKFGTTKKEDEYLLKMSQLYIPFCPTCPDEGRNSELLPIRKTLPVDGYRSEFYEMIASNQVVVISGETGSGKSTQIPQYILDEALRTSRASATYVVVTQPRRISAISLAQRVAAERGETLGQSVGYQIRMTSRHPRERGSILYCTNGILLRWLNGDSRLSRVSHVIIDEIHERDLFSDFLLIIVRELTRVRPDLKVILMSATLNAAMFSEYFGDAPILTIPGRLHPVQPYFLEDIIEQTGFCPKSRSSGSSRRGGYKGYRGRKKDWDQNALATDGYQRFLKELKKRGFSRQTFTVLEQTDEKAFEDQRLDLLVHLTKVICEDAPTNEALLIFLPGWADIANALTALSKAGLGNTMIVPVHSLLPQLDQMKVFSSPPVGCRKIVLATSIAETSITIDDVVHVIDCGKTKMSNFDVHNNIQTLKPEWISRANAEQRRGRAGRTQPGKCYHLYTSWRFNEMDPHMTPEMQRTRLETLCLQIKLMRLGWIEPFLSKAVEPPSPQSLERALGELHAIGALEKETEELTPLGWHLARLPVDPHLGKMVIFAAMFSCLDPVLTIAACLDFKEPFHTPMGKERMVDEAKRRLAGDRCKSDYLLWAKVVDEAERRIRQNGVSGARQFSWENFVNLSSVQFVGKMKRQFTDILCQAGFIDCATDCTAPAVNCNSHSEEIISAVVAAGLYPKVAEVRPKGGGGKGHRPTLFKSRDLKRITLHPMSVNKTVERFETKFVIYHRIQKSLGGTNMLECGMTSPLSLLLFGGDLDYCRSRDEETLVLDQWINFHCSLRTAQLVAGIRTQLDSLLDRRIEKPRPFGGSANQGTDRRRMLEGRLVELTVQLLEHEKIRFKTF